MTSELLAQFEHLRREPEPAPSTPEPIASPITRDEISQAYRIAQQRERNDQFSRRTPYGPLTEFKNFEDLQLKAESAIHRCSNHKPPNCACWQDARTQLWNARRRYPDRSPESWFALEIWNSLEATEQHSRKD